MKTVFGFLQDEPLVLLFVLMAFGALIGRVHVAGVEIGPVAVLFTAMALSALGSAQGHDLALPTALSTLGLVLFTYTVGLTCGPSFFGAVSSAWPRMLTAAGALVAAGVGCVVFGRALGLSSQHIAGVLTGALTCTPALAAADDLVPNGADATVGYSLAYPLGVIGMVVAAMLVLRGVPRDDAARGPATAPGRSVLRTMTIQIGERGVHRIGDLPACREGLVRLSRLRRPDGGCVTVPGPDQELRTGDLIAAVGSADDLRALADRLGRPVADSLVLDRSQVDVRRITVSNGSLAGRTLIDLDLYARHEATVTRVRRGDVDLLAHDSMVIQLGDRLRVIAPRERLDEVGALLGDSSRGLSDINPLSLACGLCLGLLLGLVPVPLPMGSVTVGSAAGTLVMGLVLGRIGRVGRIPTGMSHTAASSLSTLGLLLFFACTGTKAGGAVSEALSGSVGPRMILLGAVTTAVAALGLVLVQRKVHRVDPVTLSGVLGGSQTQPAVLACSDTRTGFDPRVSLGYTLVYPIAMITKIVLAQVLVVL
ncbi:MAG: putative transport protein [Actinomycetota bacterium]|nr:putative transport protein [Actinomycetota bacterium]